MMQREKAGGHSERSIAHRHHRGRGLGRGRQDRRTSRCIACWPSASTAAASPTRCSAMSAAAGTGRARPSRDLQDEMRRHLDAGYTMVKMKVGGLPLADDVRRVEAVKAIVPAQARARGRCQLQVRPRRGAGLCAGARAVQAALVRGAVRSARLRAAGRDRRRLRAPLATGENLFSTQDVENLVRFGGLRPRAAT